METLTANYGIETLVDVEGAPVESDYADQADMCEIVRYIIKLFKSCHCCWKSLICRTKCLKHPSRCCG